MATVVINHNEALTACDGEVSLEITESNIEALEAACRKYREETKLPETYDDCMTIVSRMDRDNSAGYAPIFFFPQKWLDDKSVAMLKLMKVWLALHQDGFEWLKATGNSYHFRYCAYGKDVSIWDHKSGTVGSPFPFRTKALAEQARRILTDELIKTAFSVK